MVAERWLGKDFFSQMEYRNRVKHSISSANVKQEQNKKDTATGLGT